ncbi:MAG: hypothetical protein JZU49_06030 [Sulfuricurvum sp.]|nr:hypothetical protein [Sulfuricurvum sp.]
MIKIVMAPVGWGKTYYAVHELKKVYDTKTRPIFTNINLKIPYDDYLLPFDFNDFYEFCVKEYDFFQSYRNQQSELRKNREQLGEIDNDYIDEINNSSPDNYDQELKDSGLLDKYGSALIVWDECQTDLEKLDPYILRFFTYHRHFEDMDVVLITQDIGLIDRKIKRQIDEFVVGQSPSKRILSSSFQYKIYNNHRMFTKHEKATLSLPSSKKIFSLYDSGGYKKQPSVFFKKIAPIIFLVILITSIWKLLIVPYVFGGGSEKSIESSSTVPSNDDSFREQNPDDHRTVDQMKSDALSERDPNGGLTPPPAMSNGSFSSPQSYENNTALNRYLIRFQCSQSYCYFPQNRFTIPLNSLDRFLQEFGGKILMAEPINKDVSIITAVVPSELYNMIETHKILSGSDNYGLHSEKNNYGTSMVPNNVGTPNTFTQTMGI